MDQSVKYIAFDLGASSGRTILGSFDGKKLRLEEIHRFTNEPVSLSGSLYWDIQKIFSEIKTGLTKCNLAGIKNIASLSVDTWGVDFGLLDKEGRLIGNPYCYRDKRTNGIMDELFKVIPKGELYKKTGIQLMEINTIFQLFSMVKNDPRNINSAASMLMMPDLINYFLTGIKAAEKTIAGTTQLLNPDGSVWLYDIIKELSIPEHIFPDIIPAGSCVGYIKNDIALEAGLGSIPVIATASHDTQAAIAAIPSESDDFIYLSCGTWSLIGTETEHPNISARNMRFGFTNEVGAGSKTNFHRNVIGLWIIQECKKYWEQSGENISFSDMVEYAKLAEPFESFIDPNNPSFMSPGSMPDKIRKYCLLTGQKIPDSKGSITRCILQSMAMEYKASVYLLEDILSRRFEKIHIVGGGTNNKLLCQFTADATGKPVIAGPVEATAIGNIAIQAVSAGEITDLKQAKQIVAASFPSEVYTPSSTDIWDAAYETYKKILLNFSELKIEL